MKIINSKINQMVKSLFASAKKIGCLLMLLTGLSLSGCDNIEVSVNGHQLTSLSVTDVVITPVFRPGLSDYSATVPFSVSSILLQASADAGATMTINGTAFSGSGTFPLNVGANGFSVVVIGKDGASQTYTITITREPPSTNANLINLTVSAGSLNPVFASQSFVYGVSVDSNTLSTTITPTSEDANASITVNGSSVNSGATTTDLGLNVGDNAISIIVTAEDGTTIQTYTVTVSVNVIVDSTEPVITLLGANPLNLVVGDTYTDPGATAFDNFDGDITANIVVGGDIVSTAAVGTFMVTYDVSDLAGNPATQATRTVIVNAIADTTEPVLTLLGANPLNLIVGDTYTDPGATAFDNFDGDITANIVVGGDTVNTAAVGTFTVTYDVSDLAGNAATQATRTINVSAVIGSYAFYPNNGSNWNDYLLNDGTNQFDASDTAACVGNETGGYSACIHGGEMRAFEVPDQSECGDLVATDSLGAFDWVCDGSTNPVRMVSTRLKSINAVTGTTDGPTLSFQLVDSTATFITDGVVAADKVLNTTATAITTVVSVDSETQLTIATNNFAMGDGYSINSDKNLSDLLDFVTPGWLNNSITVTGTGLDSPFTTPPAAWWSNPVVIDNDGLTAGDAVASSIYLITSDPNAVYTLDASRVALVIQPGVTLTQSGAIPVVSQNFLWLEGTISISSSAGADWNSVNFSVLRNVSVLGPVSSVFGTSTGGVYFRGSSNNSLSNIFADNHQYGILLDVASTYNSLSNTTFVNNTRYGVYINDSSNNNSLSNVTTNNNEVGGVSIFGSSDNSLSNITANNTGSTGVVLSSSSNNNSLSNITANNNVLNGIFLNSSDNNSLSNLNTANNGDNGVDFFNSSYNSLLNVTTANNDDDGIYFIGSFNNSLTNITAANNVDTGIRLNNSGYNFLSNITTTNSVAGLNFANNSNNTTVENATTANHGSFGIFLLNSTGNNFTSLLKVGSNVTADCSGAGAGTGINNDCTPEGSSDHTLTTGVTLAASLVGKVTTSDTVNLSDINGTANYPADSAIFNWSSFENTYRSWGVDGDAFPDVGATNRGQWTTGTGRIWDWSLLTADTVIQEVLTKYLTGNAANSIEHTWLFTAANQADCTEFVPGSEFIAVDDCRTTLLRNAVEISDTGGNDNGLCETDETCLYTPNIGSYQGHGALISAGVFTAGDGTITGVTLMEYSINGY